MGTNGALLLNINLASFLANGALVEGYAVVASTDSASGEQRVAPAAAISQHATFSSIEVFVGIADRAAATGTMGAVQVAGRRSAVGGGVITAGDYVIWQASGKFTSYAHDAAKFAFIAGYAASDCAGDGSPFDLMIEPNLIGPASGSSVNLTLTGILAALTGTFSGAVTVGATLGVTGDISAAGGFRQNVGFWFQENVAANQASVLLNRSAGTAAKRWVAPRAGSLMGISGSLSVAAAGSPLICKVFKNGSLIDAAALITFASATSDTTARITFSKDTAGLTFAAGDYLEVVVISDGSWTATTADLGVDLEVEC